MHTLRLFAATLLLQGGACDIVQLQRLLGHSRLDTTEIDLHADAGDLRRGVERRPLAPPQCRQEAVALPPEPQAQSAQTG